MRIGLDLDGTIISCKEKHLVVLDFFLKGYGVSISKQKFWDLKQSGLSTKQSLKELSLPSELCEKIGHGWNNFIENLVAINLDTVFDFSKDTLTRLTFNGHELHLISARSCSKIGHYQLNKLGLSSFFRTINFVNPYDKLAKRELVNKYELDYYIGDTEVDYNITIDTNACPIIVHSGMRSFQFFNKLNVTSLPNISYIRFDD